MSRIVNGILCFDDQGDDDDFRFVNAAQNDTFTFTEDQLLLLSSFNRVTDVLTVDVTANDKGGREKVLYSLDDGINYISDLLKADALRSGLSKWEATLSAVGGGDKIRIDNGKVDIDLTNSIKALTGGSADINALAVGDSIVDTFDYAIKLGEETLSWAKVVLRINGSNDAASITGSASGALTEDAALPVTGTLTVADVDHGQGHSRTVSNALSTGGLGTYSVDADGHWSYKVDNAAVQYLGSNQSTTDSFVVTSLDGTAQQTVTVTIGGVNDEAMVSGTATGSVSEDATTPVTGIVSVLDSDAGQSHTLAVNDVVSIGGFGTYSVDGDGHWSYKLNTAAVQHLNSNQSTTDTFVVDSVDGTAHQTVTITIDGADEITTGSRILAEYHFAGGPAGATAGTIVDTSGNNLNGSLLSGNPTFSSDRPPGDTDFSLHLGTSDAAVFNYPFPFITQVNATLEFWINPDGFSPNDAVIFWTTTGSGDTNRFNIGLFPGNILHMDYRDDHGVLHELGIGSALPNGTWSKIDIVKADNVYSMYVDDHLVSMVTDASPNLPTSTGWTINGRATEEPAAPFQFSGLLDDIKITGDGVVAPADHLTFSTTIVPAGSGCARVSVGDFNEDGKADLVTSYPYGSDGHTSILIGNGDGSFQAAIPIATGNYPDALAIADFNGDGHQDLAISNFNQGVNILLGNGDGSFAHHTDLSVGSGSPWTLATGDFNGDGHTDLISGTYGIGKVSVFLGQGDGGFTGGQTFAMPDTAWGIAVGDLSGDGKADIVVGTAGSRTFSVLISHGDGTFENPVQYQTAGDGGPSSVALGDLNGDGKLDLAVTNDGPPGSVAIFMGNGDGTFGAGTAYGGLDHPYSVLIRDFNEDTKLDLAVSTNQGPIDVFLGNGDGTFQFPDSYSAATNDTLRQINTADLNGDGHLDLLGASQLGVSILLNTSFDLLM